ncbi:DUF3422 domain-containing protein [Kozakia baliensis]|uniref:DUF3422 domain-containing protein n=1 Tax=Kozakia baliensis TaxID=153496 RepID=UPI0021C0CE22|nr:DUF3422 domain-containing protein [Kozakia baliensis]
MALLNVPVLQEAVPLLQRIETRLAAITGRIRGGVREHSEALMTELADLSAELEANATATLFRLGASRGYYAILDDRLTSLDETVIDGCYRWRNFLRRRIAPAMQTCGSVEERQAALSDKLARAMALLRSWIDVQLERQNGALLASMNNRARQQLHLQHTVEGLSVAAISYYVVSLLAHVIDGLPGFETIMPSGLAVAILTPVVALGVWLTVRRIRNAHGDPEAHDPVGDAA